MVDRHRGGGTQVAVRVVPPGETPDRCRIARSCRSLRVPMRPGQTEEATSRRTSMPISRCLIAGLRHHRFLGCAEWSTPAGDDVRRCREPSAGGQRRLSSCCRNQRGARTAQGDTAALSGSGPSARSRGGSATRRRRRSRSGMVAARRRAGSGACRAAAGANVVHGRPKVIQPALPGGGPTTGSGAARRRRRSPSGMGAARASGPLPAARQASVSRS
jgi:hypothetical protein